MSLILSIQSKSAIAIMIRSIMVSVVSSDCIFDNSGEWHKVIVLRRPASVFR
jgi:hypothetical protein